MDKLRELVHRLHGAAVQRFNYQRLHGSSSDAEGGPEALDTSSRDSGCKERLLVVQRLIWNSGVSCMVIAALVFSLSALFVKATRGRVPVLEIAFVRSSLSWLVSAAIIRSQEVSTGGQHGPAGIVGRYLRGLICCTV